MKLTNLAYATVTAAALVAAAPATPAIAIEFDTYVSATGSDANSCAFTAPCATMSFAVSQTFDRGKVHCLDSADYFGTIVDITVDITIDCSNTTAIAGPFRINAPFITVRIVGLQILGSAFGIELIQAGALYVEKCTLFQNQNGILFTPSTNSNLFVSDSYFIQDGIGHVAGGIYIQPASGVAAQVMINNSRFKNNNFGIIADGNSGGTISGTVSNSQFAGNAANGITVSTTSTNVSLLVDQSQVSGNLHGLVAGGANAGMLVRNTSITGNTTGLFTINSGGLFSYLNNSVNGNTTDGAFTGTVGLK